MEAATSNSARSLICHHDRVNLRGLVVDGVRTPSRELLLRFDGASTVLLEATTLDLVELLELLRAARARRLKHVDLLYAEPAAYQREVMALDAPWTREFELSVNRRFEGVPGFVTDLGRAGAMNSQLVAFLGYEGARLAQACEQVETMAGWPKTAVFGIPGYAPGWEMNALANNVGTLYGMSGFGIRYCAAASVTGALEILRDIHGRRAAGEGRTVIAPLGTKPHSIASALFLVDNCEFQETTLIWDHPTRSPDRSEDVRRWHLFRVDFEYANGP